MSGHFSSFSPDGGALRIGSQVSRGFNFTDMFKNIGNFMGSKSGQGLLDLASLGFGAFGLNKSLGIQEDQLGLLKQQEGRAATAQNFNTGNSLALQLATMTPGTPEYARVEQAIADGSFAV